MFPGYTNSKFPGYTVGGGAKTPTSSISPQSGDTITPAVDSLINVTGDTNQLIIQLDTPEDEFMHDIIFFIKTGTEPAIIVQSDSPIWYAEGYELDASTMYEVNCLWNGTAWVIASMAIDVPEEGGST